jgi:hypothetical protein
MSTKNATYSAPTLEQVQKAFGKNIGEPFEVKPRACRDVQKFIAKINRIFKETKKTSIQFD